MLGLEGARKRCCRQTPDSHGILLPTWPGCFEVFPHCGGMAFQSEGLAESMTQRQGKALVNP